MRTDDGNGKSLPPGETELAEIRASREANTVSYDDGVIADVVDPQVAAESRDVSLQQAAADHAKAEERKRILRKDRLAWRSNAQSEETGIFTARTFIGDELFEPQQVEKGPAFIASPTQELFPGAESPPAIAHQGIDTFVPPAEQVREDAPLTSDPIPADAPEATRAANSEEDDDDGEGGGHG